MYAAEPNQNLKYTISVATQYNSTIPRHYPDQQPFNFHLNKPVHK